MPSSRSPVVVSAEPDLNRECHFQKTLLTFDGKRLQWLDGTATLESWDVTPEMTLTQETRAGVSSLRLEQPAGCLALWHHGLQFIMDCAYHGVLFAHP